MPSALEAVLKRDRQIVLAALGALALIAWAVTARLALDMGWMMLGDEGWTAGYFVAMFLMWAVMMVGMMLPSAAPTILVYAALARSRAPHGGPFGSAALFTAGYLASWTAFSLLATLAQWGLAESGLLASPMMIRATPALAGALFLAAGIYQLTPLKSACLGRCRSPLHFLMKGWRTGSVGAFVMGLENGAYCSGCCWALMALLFALGVMNLLWVAAIAAFVLAEKLFPAGALIARVGAVLMLAGGTLLLWPA
jgi:predicted metal-binding membrane protein